MERRTIGEIRSELLDAMCDCGELIRRGDDFYEDMGGHVSHESNLDGHIENWLLNLDPEERKEVVNKVGIA